MESDEPAHTPTQAVRKKIVFSVPQASKLFRESGQFQALPKDAAHRLIPVTLFRYETPNRDAGISGYGFLG